MNYTSLEGTLPPHVLFLMLLIAFSAAFLVLLQGLAICVGAAFWVSSLTQKSKTTSISSGKKSFSKESTMMTIAFFAVLAIAITGFVFTAKEISRQDALAQANQNAALHNLQTKYNVASVDWNASLSRAIPETTEPMDLVVEDTEGRHVVFRYSINPETHEPTLSDLESTAKDPIASGAVNVSSASLLKGQ